MTELIVVEDLWKIYRAGKMLYPALRGVNLVVEEGEFLAIVGPSGSGKSTLLHIIGGLDKPSRGKVLVDGTDITKLSRNELAEYRNRKIGFVFQFYYLLSDFTALENVLFPAMIAGFRLQEKAEQLIVKFGLKDRMRSFPGELSGGEQQRLAIIRALINQPQVLLCDEPTGNLDSKSGKQIMDLIKNLNEEMGVTVVLVTHDPSLKVYADRVINIRDGQLC